MEVHARGGAVVPVVVVAAVAEAAEPRGPDADAHFDLEDGPMLISRLAYRPPVAMVVGGRDGAVFGAQVAPRQARPEIPLQVPAGGAVVPQHRIAGRATDQSRRRWRGFEA